jgi:hypothetical protein
MTNKYVKWLTVNGPAVEHSLRVPRDYTILAEVEMDI